MKAGPAAAQLGWRRCLSHCLSDGGELHGGYGCGFKRDKSQRGERMRNGNRDWNKRKTYKAAKINILWKGVSVCPVASLAAGIRVLGFQQLEYFFCWTSWPVFVFFNMLWLSVVGTTELAKSQPSTKSSSSFVFGRRTTSTLLQETINADQLIEQPTSVWIR